MKIIDMSHVMNVHTPGWVGYAGNKMYYAQNLQTVRIVAQRIDTALHVGTHFDGAMHATDNRNGDMAHLPLDYLCNRGVVVDISKHMKDWAVITPEIIESAGADIREGDILILHTRLAQALRRPAAAGPGAILLLSPRPEPRDAALDVQEEDQMVGHGHRIVRPRHEHLDPLYAPILPRNSPRSTARPGEFFGTFEYTHKKSGRKVSADVFPFHNWAFQEGLLHAENLGGDIELMLGKRAIIGAFPWRYEGLEGCPCRIVAFLDAGENVEAVGDAPKQSSDTREKEMDLQLQGKTALVTGGSEGIGKGITLALAKEGVDVAICGRRKEVLEATASEIARATNRKIVAIPADLRKDADAKNFIEQGHKALGRVDIMVNNAGSAAAA